MLKQIFNNYDAFYSMLVSTTILSNTKSNDFDSDSDSIISLIGNAYKLSSNLISFSKDLIKNKLMELGRTIDQHAVYGAREYGEQYSDEDVLFDIKGDVLSTLNNISQLSNTQTLVGKNGWFDFDHYKTYNSKVRYSKIRTISTTGNIIATRQVGIMSQLGIGCEKNIERAVMRLKQCAYWGDIPSMYLLGYVFKLNGDESSSKIYYELAELADKFLSDGYTVLPDDCKDRFSNEACSLYVYISTIKQDIIIAHNKASIDFSFIEAITSADLDYFKVMYYINNYAKLEWKEVTNSSARPSTKLGF